MTIYDIIAWISIVSVSLGSLVYIFRNPEHFIVSVEDDTGNRTYFYPYM